MAARSEIAGEASGTAFGFGRTASTRGSVPIPKNKVRETLREKIKGSRGGKRAGAGRPLEPPRSEKEALERVRSLSAYGAERALKRVYRNALGKLPAEMTPGQITSARLVLEVAGVTKGFTLEMGDDFARFAEEVMEDVKASK